MHVGLQGAAGIAALGRVIAGIQAAGGEPVAQLVVVGGDRENHAHAKALALFAAGVDHRFQRTGTDRMHRFVALMRDVGLHLLPDRVGHGDAVAVQVHAESGNDVGLSAIADGGAQRLARKHVGAVQLTGDDPIQQNFPVGLGFQFDEQPFVHKEALLPGHRQGRHVGQFDEAEFQVWFFRGPDFGLGVGRAGQQGHRHCRAHHDGQVSGHVCQETSHGSCLAVFMFAKKSAHSPKVESRRRCLGVVDVHRSNCIACASLRFPLKTRGLKGWPAAMTPMTAYFGAFAAGFAPR